MPPNSRAVHIWVVLDHFLLTFWMSATRKRSNSSEWLLLIRFNSLQKEWNYLNVQEGTQKPPHLGQMNKCIIPIGGIDRRCCQGQADNSNPASSNSTYTLQVRDQMFTCLSDEHTKTSGQHVVPFLMKMNDSQLRSDLHKSQIWPCGHYHRKPPP